MKYSKLDLNRCFQDGGHWEEAAILDRGERLFQIGGRYLAVSRVAWGWLVL